MQISDPECKVECKRFRFGFLKPHAKESEIGKCYKCKGRKKNLEIASETKCSGDSLSVPPGSEGQFRSDDLRVMSPARSHCATSLKYNQPHTAYIGAAALSFPPLVSPSCSVCMSVYTCVYNTHCLLQFKFSNESHSKSLKMVRYEKNTHLSFSREKRKIQ